VAVFQTAVALVVFDSKQKDYQVSPIVTANHLKQVMSMSKTFKKYRTAAHNGMDDSTLAYMHRNREDKFTSTPSR
jgi:hypothetical protein